MNATEEDTTFKNRVERNGAIIYFTIADKVTDEEALRIKEAGLKQIEEILAEGSRSVSNFIDIQKSSFFSSQARSEWIEYLRHEAIHKTAIVGANTNTILKILASTIISLSGMENVKYFNDETEALQWLSS